MILSFNMKTIISVNFNNKLFIIEISKRLYKIHIDNPKEFDSLWLLKNATIHIIKRK